MLSSLFVAAVAGRLHFSFEAPLNETVGWSTGYNGSLSWTRNSGPTPSPGTGPDAAYDGAYYLYTRIRDINAWERPDQTFDLIYDGSACAGVGIAVRVGAGVGATANEMNTFEKSASLCVFVSQSFMKPIAPTGVS